MSNETVLSTDDRSADWIKFSGERATESDRAAGRQAIKELEEEESARQAKLQQKRAGA